MQSTNHVTSDEDRPSIQSPVGLGMRHFSAAFQKVKPSVSKKVRTQLNILQSAFALDDDPLWRDRAGLGRARRGCTPGNFGW